MHFPESVTGAISEFCFCGFRVLIYDRAGGANPKSWDGCNKALAQFDVAATAAKPQTWSLLWCRRQTWKMNGCGGLRLSLARRATLGREIGPTGRRRRRRKVVFLEANANLNGVPMTTFAVPNVSNFIRGKNILVQTRVGKLEVSPQNIPRVHFVSVCPSV